MRAALTWLLDHWHIPLLFLALAGAALAAILLREKPSPEAAATIIQKVTQELKVIDAGADARRAQAELGAEKAKQLVNEKYQVEKAQLDAAQAKQAQELEDDPVALARFLVKAGSKS